MELFVVGAGHVGLVTAAGFSRLGHTVTVADIDVDRIAVLRRGNAPLYEPGLDDALRSALEAGRLSFTTSVDWPARAQFAFVCVGTPARDDGSLSMEQVEAVARRLLDGSDERRTIAIRSTLPLDGPDALAHIVGGAISRPSLVVNPEFMREGSALADFQHPSRVVVGWLERERDETAASAVAALYAPLGSTSLIADARSATLIKIASNVLLATKVGFANELARLSDAIGADATTVTAGIGMDPRLGSAFLRPGPGVGGSCLPEQSIALHGAAVSRGVVAPLLEGVSRSNEAHQRAIARRVATLAGGTLAGKRIALLGLAFKADTDDVRHSPALALAAFFRDEGADVAGYDPRAGENARRADPALSVEQELANALDGADAVVIATEWPLFATLDWGALAPRLRGDLVYDARGIADAERVRAAGLRYEALGRPAGSAAAPARTDAEAVPATAPRRAAARA